MIPHIILDEVSYEIFLKQIKENYKKLILGESLIPVHEEYDYLDYIRQHNKHYEKDLTEKINFWQVYNSGFQKLSLGPHHLRDAAWQKKHTFRYLLDEQLIENFKEWHKEKNINVSTGLIAAFHMVFYKLSSQMKIPIMVIQNDREGSRYRSTIGLCFEYKRVNITLNENYTIMEFFKSIENEFLKAAPFQKCSQYIKNIGFKETPFSIVRNVISLYNKLFLSKKFKVSHPNSVLRCFYLKSLSKSKWLTVNLVFKDTINRLLHTKFRLLKPNRLTVVFNITASFFSNTCIDNGVSGLVATIPKHETVERPIGNETLWIFFSKDRFNKYRLTINGPLTADCKDLLAKELINVMTKIIENNEYQITDLIK